MLTTQKRVACALLLFAASLSSAAVWAASASHEADTAAITQLFNRFNDTFNDHDAHAMAMLFVEDADFITISGANTHGRAAIEQHMQGLFDGLLKTIHRDVTLRPNGIRFLGPDTAAIDSDFVTTGIVRNGVADPATKGLYDWIVRKQRGRWMIVIWHESNLPQAPR